MPCGISLTLWQLEQMARERKLDWKLDLARSEEWYLITFAIFCWLEVTHRSCPHLGVGDYARGRWGSRGLPESLFMCVDWLIPHLLLKPLYIYFFKSSNHYILLLKSLPLKLISERQNWLHNVQGPMQNENVGFLIQRLLRISTHNSEALNQVQGPSKYGDCEGPMPACEASPAGTPSSLVLSLRVLPVLSLDHSAVLLKERLPETFSYLSASETLLSWIFFSFCLLCRFLLFTSLILGDLEGTFITLGRNSSISHSFMLLVDFWFPSLCIKPVSDSWAQALVPNASFILACFMDIWNVACLKLIALFSLIHQAVPSQWLPFWKVLHYFCTWVWIFMYIYSCSWAPSSFFWLILNLHLKSEPPHGPEEFSLGLFSSTDLPGPLWPVLRFSWASFIKTQHTLWLLLC